MEKKKIRRKWEKLGEGSSFFPFVPWPIILFLLKRVVQRWDIFSKLLTRVSRGNCLIPNKSVNKKIAFTKIVKRCDSSPIGSILHHCFVFWLTDIFMCCSFMHDNALKCILIIYLCGRYFLIAMLNLYN